MAHSACEAVAGEILGAGQAEGMAALSQNRREQQLEANWTSENFLVDEGINFMRMGRCDRSADLFADEFSFSQDQEGGGWDGKHGVLAFARSRLFASVFSHTKTKLYAQQLLTIKISTCSCLPHCHSWPSSPPLQVLSSVVYLDPHLLYWTASTSFYYMTLLSEKLFWIKTKLLVFYYF